MFGGKDPVPVELRSNVEALHISWEQPSLNKQLYHVKFNSLVLISTSILYNVLLPLAYSAVRFSSLFHVVIYLCLALYHKFN